MFPAVTSAFKEKYPLSPKKIWKKILSGLIGSTVLSIMFGTFCGMMAMIWPLLIKSGDGEPVLINFPIFFILGFVLAIAVLVCLSYWFWSAYIRTYFYDAGAGYLTIRKGIFTPSEIHVMYQKIQDVYVDQDLFDRIMGLYDVHIASATATSGIEAHIDGVDAATADALKNFLLSSINTSSQSSASATNQKIGLSLTAPQPHVEVPTNVSSETFPISPKWIISSIISSIFSTVVLVMFFGFQFLSGQSATRNSFAMILGIVVLFGVIFGLQVGGILLWKMNFSWVFTPNFLEVRTGIISKSETHMPYSSIQDVLIKQGIIERLFGLCTVTIQNAVGISGKNSGQSGTRLPGQPLAKGNELVEIVRKMSQTGQAGRM